MKKTIKRKTLSRGSLVPGKGLFAKVAEVAAPTVRSDFPLFKAGDNLKVHVRIKEGEKERVQIYEGLCIAIKGRGASRSFNVRKISHGVGVERIFLFSSPRVAKIEVAQEGKVRRAKLYYIRGLEGKAAKIDREVDQTVAAATTKSK